MMIDFLKEIDADILLAINGANNPFLDQVMWIISGKIMWIPLGVILLWMIYRKKGPSYLIYTIAGVVLCILLADQLSVHLFKEVFQRYRPSHHLILSEDLHYHIFSDGREYRSGQFGFISSHASNFLAISTFLFLYLRDTFKKLIFVLIPICFIVGYSRIYLGVHYPSDVVAGSIFGILIGILVNFFIKLTEKKFVKV